MAKKKPKKEDVGTMEETVEPQVPVATPVAVEEPSFNLDEPRYVLPPDVHIQEIVRPLAEVIDWSADFLKLPTLWKKYKGEGVKVAILDTGVDHEHPDLQGKILARKDFTGSRFDSYDKNDHGTWCAGCVSANADENGIRGVAYESKLIIAKVLGDQGYGQDSWINSGMNWCFDQGADIFSLSLGGGRMSETLHNTFLRIAAAGKLIICAAGNDGGPINYPAAWSECCLSVGACDENGKLTRFTSRGPTLGVVAPGQNMISTIPGGTYGKMTGTSMATPMVAGITALALAKHRIEGGNTPLDNILRLRETFKKTSTPLPEGFGLVNPEKLLAMATTPGDGAAAGPSIPGFAGPLELNDIPLLQGATVLIYVGRRS